MPEPWLPISMIEKFAYCPRQAYLQFTEREDAENLWIIEGSLLHAKVTRGGVENRGPFRQARSVHVAAPSMGIYGVADVLELHGDRVYPVEYKRGKGGRRKSQHVQLGLQAMCLEEMLGRPVPEGAIYHGGSRKREPVVIDAALRLQCRDLVSLAREILSRPKPPPAVSLPGCPKCSIRETCFPLLAAPDIRAYLQKAFEV